MQNITFAYTSSSLLKAYKKRQNELYPLLKEKTRDEEGKKKVHLALLSIDVAMQIFNDANRSFPVINKEILEHANQNIPLVKNQTAGIKKLKKAIDSFSELDAPVFEKKLHYSIELCQSQSKQIPATVASNILKESSFLFTHVLHLLYNNENQEKVFDSITAQVEYILGLNIIQPISAGKEVYKEMLQERIEYKTSEDMKDELENFIFNAHHFSLLTLLFVKHWLGFQSYGLEEAEQDLNTKINDVLNQRKSTPVSA